MLHTALLGFTVVTIIITVIATFRFLRSLWLSYEKKKGYIYTFIGTFLLMFMGYGCLVASHHYSVDSFNLIFDMIPEWHLSLGRYTNAGIIVLAERFGINQVIHQRKFMLLWLVTLVVMIVMISTSLFKHMKNVNVKKYCAVIIAVSLSFLNVFGMELMLFAEMAMVFALGNLTLGLSIYYILSDIKPWKKWTLATFFLIISIGSYQSYIGVFVAFTLLGLLLKWQDEIKKRYVESIYTLILGGGVSVVNIMFANVLVSNGIVADSARGAGLTLDTIVLNIKALAVYQIRFWGNADGLQPAGVMPLVGILLVNIIILMIKKLPTIEQRIYFILMIAGCYVLGYAPHIVEAEIALTHRSNIAIWSVIAVLFVVGFNFICVNNDKILSKISYGILMVAVVSNIYIMQDMAANTQTINQMDLMEADIIANEIREYEGQTGNWITKIAMINDENPTYRGFGTRYIGDQLGKRVMTTSYSQKSLIQYVFGRKLKGASMDESVFEQHFQGKDWQYMNADEQVVCVADTVYIAVY